MSGVAACWSAPASATPQTSVSFLSCASIQLLLCHPNPTHQKVEGSQNDLNPVFWGKKGRKGGKRNYMFL